MYKVAFTATIAGFESALDLGHIISHEDDPYKALSEGQSKRPMFVTALRATMPAFKHIKEGNIQISVKPYEIQLLLLAVPDKKRDEMLPDEKVGYELFQNDMATTLASSGT